MDSPLISSSSIFSNDLPEEAKIFIKEQGVQVVFHNNIHLFRDKESNTFTDLQTKLYNSCSDIGKEYFNILFDFTMNDQLQVKDLFDITIIVKGVTPEDIEVNNIIGFMVIEIGECDIPKYIHTPVLNLICVSQKHKDIAIGRILLFIYVYTLKSKDYSTGLLELAGNYYNLKAMCLYNKFGFVESIELKSKCFTYHDTLPMIANLTNEQMSLENILDALISNRNIPIGSHDVLCEKGHKKGPNGPLQSMEQQRRKVNFENIIKINQLLRERNKDLLLLNMEKNKITPESSGKYADILKKLAEKSRKGDKIHFVHRMPKIKTMKKKGLQKSQTIHRGSTKRGTNKDSFKQTQNHSSKEKKSLH